MRVAANGLGSNHSEELREPTKALGRSVIRVFLSVHRPPKMTTTDPPSWRALPVPTSASATADYIQKCTEWMLLAPVDDDDPAPLLVPSSAPQPSTTTTVGATAHEVATHRRDGYRLGNPFCHAYLVPSSQDDRS